MATPRPWGSATLGTATAAGGTKGVREKGTAARQGDRGVYREGRVRDEEQRKEKTVSDYEVLGPGTTEEFWDGMSQCWGVSGRVDPKWVYSEGVGHTSASHSVIRLVVLRFVVGKLSHLA